MSEARGPQRADTRSGARGVRSSGHGCICYDRPVTDAILPAVLQGVLEAARRATGLDLLILFGSRARGTAHQHSDWDVGYLASPAADIPGLLAILVEQTGSDRIDLVDLRRASGVLRFQAARDGQVLYERTPGLGDRFRLEAAHFWCDMAPILQRGHEAVLAGLDR
jgi:predicted nucleotidyltransferase